MNPLWFLYESNKRKSIKVEKTIFFVSKSRGFYYGQGECIEHCFADAYEEISNAPSYKECFNINHSIKPKNIIDEEEYCVCYDYSITEEQKSFYATGKDVKIKLLNLYCDGLVEASWIFPVSKAINIKELRGKFKNNKKSYNIIKEYLGKDWK